MHGLDTSIVWITGASMGIGHALTCHYLKKGHTVIATSRHIQKQHFHYLTADEIQRLHLMPGDVSTKADNDRIVNDIITQFQRIDIALLNAGTNEYVTLKTFNSDCFQHLMQTNFFSVVYGLEALLPHVTTTAARIGIVGSVVAYGGLPKASAYGASKAAIRNMVQSLQTELLHQSLSISLISPGFVKTPLTDKNDFAMPCIISAETAATYIAQGLDKRTLEIHFPYRFSLFLKLITSLPQSLSRYLISKGTKTHV